MRLTFWLRYHADYGQSLRLTGNHRLLGNGRTGEGIPLEYLNGEFWQATVVIAPEAFGDGSVAYSYLLREADGTVVQDWGNERRISPGSFTAGEVLIIDSWNPPGRSENVYYTEPFRQVLLKPEPVEGRAPVPSKATHIFRVKAPLLGRGQTLCLLGNIPALRQWNTVEPVLLSRRAGEDYFSVELDLGQERLPLE